MRSIALALSLVSLLAVACGGGQPEPKAPDAPTPPSAPSAPTAPTGAAPAGTTAEPTAPAGGPAKAFKDMSPAEKKAHMKTVVMPKMTAVFQAFDKKEFAEVNCMTCNGASAKTGNFAMPNASLPKLSPADMFKKHMTAKPEMTKFMMQKVVPEMAATLGAKAYDPKTHEGFGCGGCHVIEK